LANLPLLGIAITAVNVTVSRQIFPRYFQPLISYRQLWLTAIAAVRGSIECCEL
jgi:hypothetical protein